MPLVAMHWEHRFNHMVSKYNDIYRIQMLNITPHICRHTYFSNQAKAGMNPKTLQYLMGHSEIGVTLDVYTHLDSKTPLQSFTAWRNYKTPVRRWTEPKKKQFEYENDPPHHWNASVPLVRGIFCVYAEIACYFEALRNIIVQNQVPNGMDADYYASRLPLHLLQQSGRAQH